MGKIISVDAECIEYDALSVSLFFSVHPCHAIHFRPIFEIVIGIGDDSADLDMISVIQAKDGVCVVEHLTVFLISASGKKRNKRGEQKN